METPIVALSCFSILQATKSWAGPGNEAMIGVHCTEDSNSLVCLQVSLPGLHITLGVFFRLWSLLEEECHQLDIELARHSAPQAKDQVAFADYSRQIKEIAKLEIELMELTQYTSNLELEVTAIAVQMDTTVHSQLLEARGFVWEETAGGCCRFHFSVVFGVVARSQSGLLYRKRRFRR